MADGQTTEPAVYAATCPTCPHCGHRWEEWWRDDQVNTEDRATSELECGACEQPFVVTTSVRLSFTSRPVKEVR